MKLLVTGGRNFSDSIALWKRMSELDPETVIHGAARGADTLAGQWARDHNREEIAVPAKWDALGKIAGRMRNQVMIEMNPDLVLACPGGTGTQHMCIVAKWAKVPVEKLDA